MSTFVKNTNVYSVTPSKYISSVDFVKIACTPGPKYVFLEYSPCLRISRQAADSLRFEYYNDTGRNLATTFNPRSPMKIPPGIAHIFVSAQPRLLGAWTTNQKPVGMDTLIDISAELDIPLPESVVTHSRQAFAISVLEIVRYGSHTKKVCFFHGNTQGHVSKSGLAGVGLCTLGNNTIQRIPTGDKSETLAWFWLEYLLQNNQVTSEGVDKEMKTALLTNSIWLVKALELIGKKG